ncbi:MAG: helix-turn-helix transcriptional regulator [Caulobacter sp.]|nr:helix-turn-helix transcriptional regulator [Caulobacter sp.]
MGRFFDLDDREIRHEYVEEALIADVQFEISKLMRRNGISKAELARRLGVSAPYVTQILGNEGANLTLKTVARVFDALGDVAVISTARGGEVKSKGGAHISRPGWFDVTCANDTWNVEVPEIATSTRAPEESVVWLNALCRVA